MAKFKTPAIALASAVAGVFLWQALQDEPEVAVRVETTREYVFAPPSAAAADTAMALASPLGAPIAAPAVAPVAKTDELGRKLLGMTNVQEFVTDALKQPEKGGVFYAMLALRQCDDIGQPMEKSNAVIQRVVAVESTISQARLDAVSTPLTRCAGFTQDQIDALKSQVAKLAVDGRDPLYRMMLSLKVPPSERGEAIDKIIKYGNSALIAEANIPDRLLQMATTWDDVGPTVRFGGKAYGKDEYVTMLVAAQLGACVEGDYCRYDMLRQGQCWNTGACYATREEYVRQKYFKDDPAGFAKTLKFAEQIRRAMATGDTSIFR